MQRLLSMKNPANPETAALQQKVESLEAQVESLQQLVADLLLKNQVLRESVVTRFMAMDTKVTTFRVIEGARKPRLERG